MATGTPWSAGTNTWKGPAIAEPLSAAGPQDEHHHGQHHQGEYHRTTDLILFCFFGKVAVLLVAGHDAR